MSHDIRTPINGIRGMVEIARHYRGDEARQEECLNKIMSASGFLLELVNNVLDMNKLESGEVQMENKPFDVCDLVEEAAVIIEAQTVEKTVTLHKEIHHDGHCHVFGSPLHVRQVLQNLLGNAVKYNKVGGEIFLTSREIALTEDTVTFEFTVRDTGKGMSEAFQQRAFEPFAQEEASARSSYVGTGLGLAIVKELVEKMGGEITLQSEKNVGSTFTVRLTFKQDKDAQRADDDAHGGAVSIRGTKVLLVERPEYGNRRVHAAKRGRGCDEGGGRTAGGGCVCRLQTGRHRRDSDGCDDARDGRAGGRAAHSQPEPAGREDDTDFRDDGQRLCRRRGAQPAGGHERASDQAARRPGAAEDDREIQKTRKVTALMKSILRAALMLLVRRDRGRD